LENKQSENVQSKEINLIMKKFADFMSDVDNQKEFFEEFNGVDKISLENFNHILNHFKINFTSS